MTEKDKARATLQICIDTCSAAVDAMKQQNTETPLEPSASAPALAVLHKDLFSLLTLIYAATTKLTLSLRAEEPAYRAALGPLQDLTTNISAIATCATLFDAHGLTLASDVKQVVREVCIALSALGHTLLVDGDDHLVHTGMVHELVDKAKRDLPADNRAAVKKRWASDRGMLEDSLQDVTSMIEDNDAEDEFDEFDDELDDLGLGSSKKMSEVELARTKKIQPLIRFTTLLHKRVQLDILAKPSLEPTSSVILDSLPSHSHAILVALEDTVATLYAPQDPSAIASAISPLAKSIEELRSALSPMLPPALSATEVASGGASTEARGPQKDVRKWFTACFDQIDRLSHNLRDALAQESSNST